MIELPIALKFVERRTATFILAVLLGWPTFLSAQQKAPLDAEQLVRGMVDNELESGRQHQSHWMYQLQRQEGDKTTVKEIVETKDCEIDSLLSLNGEALTPDQRQKENERLGKLVNDPAEQRKKKHGQEEDDHMAIEMFKMLPEAFSYRYGSSRGSLVELDFAPNPDFRASSREAQVFHAMDGKMWIDADKKRLVELDGRLAQDVEFLGGLFGHLEKGGHFAVRRAELTPGEWVITQLVVEIKGKALIFKSINLRQSDSMTDFRRVPADLSLADAVEMLKRPGTAEVAGGLAGSEGNIRAGH
jgi:hypothetical protein